MNLPNRAPEIQARFTDPAWSSAWIYLDGRKAKNGFLAAISDSEGVADLAVSGEPETEGDYKGKLLILAWLPTPIRHLRHEDAERIITTPGLILDGCDHTLGKNAGEIDLSQTIVHEGAEAISAAEGIPEAAELMAACQAMATSWKGI